MFANEEWTCETIGTLPSDPIKSRAPGRPFCLSTHDLTVLPSGMLCTLQDLWVINLIFHSSLMICWGASWDHHKNHRAGPATALASIRKMSLGTRHKPYRPGWCLRHFSLVALLSVGWGWHNSYSVGCWQVSLPSRFGFSLSCLRVLTVWRPAFPRANKPGEQGGSQNVFCSLVLEVTFPCHFCNILLVT